MAIALNIPASNGTGAASDVSGLDPEKTFVIGGTLAPGEQIVIEGTADPAGVAGWAGLAVFAGSQGNSVQVPSVAKTTPTSSQSLGPNAVEAVVNWMRVRRVSPSVSTATPTVSVDSTITATQAFQAVAVPAAPGVGANTNVAAQGTSIQATVSGAFGPTEQVLLEGSIDGGVSFDTIFAFTSPGTQARDNCRYSLVRVTRQGSGPAPATIQLFLGTSSAGAGGGGFPGFGAAPPAVASASAAGVAGTASRSDHTHALDILAYNPSPAAMQATGLIQQTYAAPTATPTVLNVASGRIPFGNAGVLATDSSLKWDNANKTFIVSAAVSADPFAGFISAGIWDNDNLGTYQLCLANANAGAGASTNLLFLAGSVDGSVGANTSLSLNGPATAAGLGGPQQFLLLHQPTAAVTGALVIHNNGNVAGADIVFLLTNGAGGIREGGRFINGSEFPQFVIRRDISSSAGNDLRVTAAAGQALTLTGKAVSVWSTDAGGITIRANNGGVLGATSTQFSMSAGADITTIGNLTGAAGLSSLGTAAAPWDSAASKLYTVSQAGVSVGAYGPDSLTSTKAATFTISKSNGVLGIGTLTANDVNFSTNGAASFGIDNATNRLRFQAASITAAGAVVVNMTNAPAGVAATPIEYLTVLNPAGTVRYIPLLGA